MAEVKISLHINCGKTVSKQKKALKNLEKYKTHENIFELKVLLEHIPNYLK